MCNKGQFPKIKMRNKGFKMKLRTLREPKIRKNTQVVVIEQLAVSNSTVLNQELNWGSTDWNREAELSYVQGI